jgi:hypothetical protein
MARGPSPKGRGRGRPRRATAARPGGRRWRGWRTGRVFRSPGRRFRGRRPCRARSCAQQGEPPVREAEIRVRFVDAGLQPGLRAARRGTVAYPPNPTTISASSRRMSRRARRSCGNRSSATACLPRSLEWRSRHEVQRRNPPAGRAAPRIPRPCRKDLPGGSAIPKFVRDATAGSTWPAVPPTAKTIRLDAIRVFCQPSDGSLPRLTVPATKREGTASFVASSPGASRNPPRLKRRWLGLVPLLLLQAASVGGGPRRSISSSPATGSRVARPPSPGTARCSGVFCC